jgi:hypothetical protein
VPTLKTDARPLRSDNRRRPLCPQHLIFEQLISELNASLTPPQRAAFEAAARAALVAAGCSGCGAAYRLLAPLQKAFWDAPPDTRALAGPRHIGRRSKLIEDVAIGAPDAREGARDRHRLRAV